MREQRSMTGSPLSINFGKYQLLGERGLLQWQQMRVRIKSLAPCYFPNGNVHSSQAKIFSIREKLWEQAVYTHILSNRRNSSWRGTFSGNIGWGELALTASQSEHGSLPRFLTSTF